MVKPAHMCGRTGSKPIVETLPKRQSQITGRLAQTLHLELVQDAARRIEQERSVDPDARDLVMRGWAWWLSAVFRRQPTGKLNVRSSARSEESTSARSMRG